MRYQQGPPKERGSETGFYMRHAEIDAGPEYAGRAYCQYARVKMDQEIDQYQIESVVLPEEQTKMDEISTPAKGVETRSQRIKNGAETKRKSEEQLKPYQDHVPGTEGPKGVYNNNPKMIKTQANEEVDDLKELGLRIYGPLLPSAENLSKLAWGTGPTESAEIYQILRIEIDRSNNGCTRNVMSGLFRVFELEFFLKASVSFSPL